MGRRVVWVKAVLVLALAWAAVWGIRSYAGSRKVTAERVNEAIAEARFDDWSGQEAPADSPEAKQRQKELKRIAEMVNRLDFQEREKNRRERVGEEFFEKLSPREKSLFIEWTVVETMSRFMESLDAMPPDQRRKFVEQGLKEIEEGRTQADMERANELGEDVLQKISQEGMRAYFEKSSADTKLDLAPLMEAMNEVMQGLRGDQLGLRY